MRRALMNASYSAILSVPWKYDASPGFVEGERAIKIHAPVLLSDQGQRLLSLDPLNHEIRQSLRLDCRLGDVGYVQAHELEGPLGDPPHGESS
jgi:hypothetical protein